MLSPFRLSDILRRLFDNMAASLVSCVRSFCGYASYRSGYLSLRHAYRYVFFLIIIAHLLLLIDFTTNDSSVFSWYTAVAVMLKDANNAGMCKMRGAGRRSTSISTGNYTIVFWCWAQRRGKEYVYRSGVGLLTDGDVDEFRVGQSELTHCILL